MPSGGGGNQTTVQKADPWEGQQPFLSQIFAEAKNLYDTKKPSYYPGETLAQVNPDRAAAADWLTKFAKEDAGKIGAKTAQALDFGTTTAMDVENNPYAQKAIQAAIRPMQENFSQIILPGISSAAQEQGAYGGARHGLATATAATNLSRDVGDTAAKMSSDLYGKGLDTFSRTLAAAPGTYSMLTAPGTILDTVGTAREARNQDEIDNAIAKWNWEQGADWGNLANFSNMVQGNYGGSSTSTSANNQSPFRSILGGAISGGTLGSMLAGGQAGTIFGAPGMAVGAGLGALLSIL